MLPGKMPSCSNMWKLNVIWGGSKFSFYLCHKSDIHMSNVEICKEATHERSTSDRGKNVTEAFYWKSTIFIYFFLNGHHRLLKKALVIWNLVLWSPYILRENTILFFFFFHFGIQLPSLKYQSYPQMFFFFFIPLLAENMTNFAGNV